MQGKARRQKSSRGVGDGRTRCLTSKVGSVVGAQALGSGKLEVEASAEARADPSPSQ